MATIATTLEGIDLLSMRSDIERAANWPVDMIEVEVVHPASESFGGFGEFMVAHIAAWSNVCVNVRFAGGLSDESLLNAVACGADIVTLSSELLNGSARSAIAQSKVLLAVELSSETSSQQVSGLSFDIAYLDLSRHQSSSLPSMRYSTSTQLRALYEIPENVALYVKIPVQTISHLQIDESFGWDVIAAPFFGVLDPSALIRRIRRTVGNKPHPAIAPALPSGLPIPRDRERLSNLFDSLDAELPPMRQQRR